MLGTSCRLPSSPVPSGRGRRGGNSHLPMVAMSSPTESQWDVMRSSRRDANSSSTHIEIGNDKAEDCLTTGLSWTSGPYFSQYCNFQNIHLYEYYIVFISI